MEQNRNIYKIPKLNPKGEPWKIVYPNKESITKFFNELREDMKTNPFWNKFRKNGE